MLVLDRVKSGLLSNPFMAEAPQIISALCDQLLDSDENVRKQVVAAICDVACRSLNAVPLETVKNVAERLHDKSLLVKMYTMERLADIYRAFCENSPDTVKPNEYAWIPGKILRCLYDEDFRPDIIESVLCGSLFPSEFSINYMVKHWVEIFSGFDEVQLKALEKIMEQKQRLQQEMQKYMALRQMSQDNDNPEVQKKIMFSFRVMSRSFADSKKAEESFQILDQLKDNNIWKILKNLVDPNISFHEARLRRDDLLKILGEKHRLYEFMNTLSVKCFLLLFNKEHVKAVLAEVVLHKPSKDYRRLQSCMNILVIIARFCPFLLIGSEGELMNFLKDNNDMIKEGVLKVLAKAGGTIREQPSITSSYVDLMLEKFCLEGSRTHAKYAVHALAAITMDDGLKSLSVVYKRLVDMLEEKTHLPTVLQSLGCIAQTSMPVFETRESEIEEYIINKILKSDSKEDQTRASWDDKSDICMLKIYGIKTLVKSYTSIKYAHDRPSIDGLLDILRNILSYGEISKDLQSSLVDKAHLRLASAKAVLRLSRLWDHKIPADIFHLALRTPEICFPEAKKVFLSKVHQYIKEGLLDAKYACSFIFNIFESKPEEFAEDKHNLIEIIQMHQQLKERHLSVQSDANSVTAYPEYILPYLVHALANISCPNIDECKDVKAYTDIYRQLHLILSLLLHKDEDANSEVDTKKEKEVLSTITIIFQSIKHSEDIVDASKSKNSHAICDLGLAITKRLVQKDIDFQGLSSSVSLPPMLYKACEKDNDTVVREVKTWLADDSVLAQLESLTLQMVPSQLAEGDALKESENDGNEMPLGKLVKNIKSQGTKGKKVKKNKFVPAETKDTENDIDILKIVREINLDNKLQENPVCAANKKRGGEETHSPVPKCKRSGLTSGIFRSSSTSKGSRRFSGEESSGAKTLVDAKINPDTDIEVMLRKVVRGNDHSLKPTVKVSEIDRNDEADKYDEHDLQLQSPDNLNRTGNTQSGSFKSSTRSTKKAKRKSVGGLVKCTAKEGENDAEDLIGCRVKVWWPLDKQFYEGTVKSYDPVKRKHVIFYHDGDVETLRLEKERWELIDRGHKPTKRDVDDDGSLRENVYGEEPGSEGNQSNNDDGSRPRKMKKYLKEFTSPDSAKIAEVSDDEPLSKWILPSRK